MLRNAANFIGFQVGWFGCVLSMAAGYPLAGVGLVGVLVAVHVLTAPQNWRELTMVLVIALGGAVVDTALSAAGWWSLAGANSWLLTYVWFAAFWGNFATVLNRSLAWLQSRYWLAMVLGAAGGPAAYVGAQQLGAIALLRATPSTMTVLAIYWGAAMPLVVWLAARFSQGVPVPGAPTADPHNGVAA